eukprot:TRINITY_DN2039_c0_g3_i4.p1 TRINITY_DN2039_c0_g3~~TRINITY_DN2039_c0_g3_i4.p1  ORF type:complete len:205 (+),score=61.77 TRINITY_DN2039_c0_g3_i4:318-932(+)
MQISFVKSPTMDSWTERQLGMMREGGNSKFKAFLNTYALAQQPPAMKYRTKAAEHYRKNLKARVEGEAFDEAAPGIEEGKEVAPGFDQPPLIFPVESLQEKPKKSVLQQISGGFFAAIGAVKNAGIKAKEKIEEAKVGEKITGAASTAGNFIVDKTKLAATAVKTQGSKITVSLLPHCSKAKPRRPSQPRPRADSLLLAPLSPG